MNKVEFQVSKTKKATNQLRYFAYFRKSTESDERQVQSIPDQKAWADEVIDRDGLIIKQSFQESMSARKTGRPVFDDMLAKIDAGEADGLMAYDPSRLARNAIDGARIIEFLDNGKLKHLIFASYSFENTSMGKFMLGFFFAQSKLYTDNLREVIIRGMRSKASKGVYPGKAKIGYFNHPKTKEILPDPDKFHLIMKAFKLYVTNRYSLTDLSHELFKMGLKNRKGGYLAKRSIADILTDPFYYGAFKWSGELWQGTHKPAISKKLWDKTQEVYSNRSKPQAKWSKDKIFCGLFRCGNCGAAITSERHTKQQKNGNVHTWIYYRCTKKIDKTCKGKFLREESLAEQIHHGFMKIALPDEMALKMLGQLERWEINETSRTSEQRIALREESVEIEAKLRRLNSLVVDGEIDREEYSSRKAKLVNEKIVTEARMKALAHDGVMFWLEPLRELINTVSERNLKTVGGDFGKLRDLIAEGGSNLLIKSLKVLWNWNSPYEILASRGSCSDWWRRRELNPRPVTPTNRYLRV